MSGLIWRTKYGTIYPGEDRPTEPPDGYFDGGDEEETEEQDDGIDLDDGYVFQVGRGFTRM